MKRGWHWFMCNKCGEKYWRGHNAKFCYGGAWVDCRMAVAHGLLVHMEETCQMLGVCGAQTKYHSSPQMEAFARRQGYFK